MWYHVAHRSTWHLKKLMNISVEGSWNQGLRLCTQFSVNMQLNWFRTWILLTVCCTFVYVTVLKVWHYIRTRVLKWWFLFVSSYRQQFSCMAIYGLCKEKFLSFIIWVSLMKVKKCCLDFTRKRKKKTINNYK